MSHTTNAKRTIKNDQTSSPAMKSVAAMNWKTNRPNPYNLTNDEISEYKKMIVNTVCNGKCCQ